MTDSLLKKLDKLSKYPDKELLLYFLNLTDEKELSILYSYADDMRKELVGDEIHLRAIIEFTNYCGRDCIYCGINCEINTVRYRMMPDEIVDAAFSAYNKGYKTVVLQGGEDSFYTADKVIYIIENILKKCDMAITLAIGEREKEEYKAFIKAGASRFLLKHETSDRNLYEKLHPGMSYDNRMECLKNLKKLGFQTGSGIMIGLPGQTLESIADDITLFKELDIDMIGCGPFIPHPQTRLASYSHGTADLSYKVLSLNRIVTGATMLPATTALSNIGEESARIKALQRGANVVMPNETPSKYRALYEIYPNKGRIEVSDRNFRKELEEEFRTIGRTIAEGKGDRS